MPALSLKCRALTFAAASFLLSAPVAALASTVEMSGECDGTQSYDDLIRKFEKGALYYNPISTATGDFQFVFQNFVRYGYIDPIGRDGNPVQKPPAGEGEWSNVRWTGKDGIHSRMDYVNSSTAQANMLSSFTTDNLTQIQGKWEDQIVDGVPLTAGGVGAASHMMGAGAFNAWANSGFSPSGLSAKIASDHNMTQAQYQEHLLKRIAAGGCYDPSIIDATSLATAVDFPGIVLIDHRLGDAYPPNLPGQF